MAELLTLTIPVSRRDGVAVLHSFTAFGWGAVVELHCVAILTTSDVRPHFFLYVK